MKGELDWIKVNVDSFDNNKIRLISHMPQGDSVICIWFRLLLEAGKNNDEGYIYMNESIPYTCDMLGKIFDRSLKKVQYAIDILKQFMMIEVDNDNFIKIKNWNKYQSVDKLEAIRESGKERTRRCRAKKKAAMEAAKLHDAQEAKNIKEDEFTEYYSEAGKNSDNYMGVFNNSNYQSANNDSSPKDYKLDNNDYNHKDYELDNNNNEDHQSDNKRNYKNYHSETNNEFNYGDYGSGNNEVNYRDYEHIDIGGFSDDISHDCDFEDEEYNSENLGLDYEDAASEAAADNESNKVGNFLIEPEEDNHKANKKKSNLKDIGQDDYKTNNEGNLIQELEESEYPEELQYKNSNDKCNVTCNAENVTVTDKIKNKKKIKTKEGEKDRDLDKDTNTRDNLKLSSNVTQKSNQRYTVTNNNALQKRDDEMKSSALLNSNGRSMTLNCDSVSLQNHSQESCYDEADTSCSLEKNNYHTAKADDMTEGKDYAGAEYGTTKDNNSPKETQNIKNNLDRSNLRDNSIYGIDQIIEEILEKNNNSKNLNIDIAYAMHVFYGNCTENKDWLKVDDVRWMLIEHDWKYVKTAIEVAIAAGAFEAVYVSRLLGKWKEEGYPKVG